MYVSVGFGMNIDVCDMCVLCVHFGVSDCVSMCVSMCQHVCQYVHWCVGQYLCTLMCQYVC